MYICIYIDIDIDIDIYGYTEGLTPSAPLLSFDSEFSRFGDRKTRESNHSGAHGTLNARAALETAVLRL